MNRHPPHRPLPRRPGRGFTLIELLVTIAIVGILLAIAAPAMKTAITGRAVAAQTSELVAGLHYARSEAMKRSGPVTICKVTAAAPTTCSTAGTTTWANWIVFAENSGSGTGNATGTLDSSETVLRSQVQPQSSYVDWRPASPAALDYVTFQATGIALASVDNTPRMTFLVNPLMAGAGTAAFKRVARQVCLNSQGRSDVIDGNATCP